MTFIRAIIAVLLFGFAIAGCGQSGPLYLPGNPSEVQSVGGQPGAQAPQGQTDSNDEDDDDDGG